LDSLETYSNISLRLLQRLPGAQVAPLMEAALRDLRQAVPFDAGWWGWARIHEDRAVILSSALMALPGRFRHDWQARIAGCDPLARHLTRHPRVPALYDRLADRPDSPVAAFAGDYGIRHVMRGIGRPDPNRPHLFLSLYRKGDAAPAWNAAEIALFARVVPLLDSAVQHCDLSCNAGKAYDEMFMDLEPGGTVLARSPRSIDTLRSFFPDWQDGGVVPRRYLSRFTRLGRHRIRKLGLVIEVAPAALRGERIDIRCVEVRREGPRDLLSPKELQVAQLLAGGDCTGRIAERLGKSPHTVRNQVQSIYGKLGISSRAELGAIFR